MIVIHNTARGLKTVIYSAVLIAASPFASSAQVAVTKPDVKSYQYILEAAKPDSGKRSTYSYYGTPLVLANGQALPQTIVDLSASSRVLKKRAITTTVNSILTAPADDMPTVKPDMSEFNMPVKKPDGDLSALSKDLSNGPASAASPINYALKTTPPEIETKLIGNSKADLGPVTIGFGFVPGGIQTMITVKLPNKKGAEISLVNKAGKTLWSGQTTNDKFGRPLDIAEKGTYYLVVKQGKSGMVSKIVGE